MLYEILLLICQWCNIAHPGLFLMKIHPVEKKLYIINGGTTALVFDESHFIDQPVICKDIMPKSRNLCTAYLYSHMYLIY